MSQKDITQNPKACQEKCKKNSWINFAMNSVIFVLTIIKRAILGKHSAKCTAYLSRWVFLHERLHWEKKECNKRLWRQQLRSLWWFHWSGLLQGAVAEQDNEPLCWGEAGTEDGEGRGCPQRSCLSYSSGHLSSTKISAVTFKHQVRSDDPQSCFLYETSSHTQRGLGLVWRQCFSTSAKSYTLQIAELVGSFLSSYRFSHLVTLISPTSHITALLFIRSEFVRMYKPLPMNWVHNRKVKQEKQPSEEYTEVYAENFDQFYSHFQFFLRFLEFD